MSASKLLDSLRGVSGLIRQERGEKELLMRYSEEMRENTEHEKHKFFTQLVSGELSMAEAIETGKQYGMNLTAPVYGVMLFKVFGGAGERKQAGLLIEVCEKLEEMVYQAEYAYSFQRGVDGWAYLLTAEDERQMDERIRGLARQIKELMDGYSISAG